MGVENKWMMPAASNAINVVKSRALRRDMTYLRANGYRVLRFWNNEVMTNIEGVLESIREAVATPVEIQPPPLTPPHAPRGRGML